MLSEDGLKFKNYLALFNFIIWLKQIYPHKKKMEKNRMEHKKEKKFIRECEAKHELNSSVWILYMLLM